MSDSNPEKLEIVLHSLQKSLLIFYKLNYKVFIAQLEATLRLPPIFGAFLELGDKTVLEFSVF